MCINQSQKGLKVVAPLDNFVALWYNLSTLKTMLEKKNGGTLEWNKRFLLKAF